MTLHNYKITHYETTSTLHDVLLQFLSSVVATNAILVANSLIITG